MSDQQGTEQQEIQQDERAAVRRMPDPLALIVGRFWERSRYDWSQPGTIRQTVIDSNVVEPGSTWELAATPASEGSEVVMRLNREFRPSAMGKVGWTLNRLAGTWMWRSYLRRALAEAEKRGIRDGPGT